MREGGRGREGEGGKEESRNERMVYSRSSSQSSACEPSQTCFTGDWHTVPHRCSDLIVWTTTPSLSSPLSLSLWRKRSAHTQIHTHTRDIAFMCVHWSVSLCEYLMTNSFTPLRTLCRLNSVKGPLCTIQQHLMVRTNIGTKKSVLACLLLFFLSWSHLHFPSPFHFKCML